MQHRLWACVGALALLGSIGVGGCDSGEGSSGIPDSGAVDTTGGPDATGGDSGVSADTTGGDAAGGTDGTAIGDAGPGDGGPTPDATPDAAPVGGPPAPAGYSGAACPSLAAGTNAIVSGGQTRSANIWLPASPAGAGVMFLWHGFGDTGANFGNAIGAQNIANQFGIIVVSAQAVVDPLETEKLADFKALAAQLFGGSMPPTWSLFDDPELDLTLFDDVLSCLDEQYAIDRTRVHTTGFSAGALWSTILLLERADWLASAVLWSGGLGSDGGFVEIVNTPYETPARKLPVLSVSGGATDLWPNAQFALVDFVAGSDELSASLVADGFDMVRCDHGLGHTIPAGAFSWGLHFLLDHHWTEGGGMLYDNLDGKGFPAYCAIGPDAP